MNTIDLLHDVAASALDRIKMMWETSGVNWTYEISDHPERGSILIAGGVIHKIIIAKRDYGTPHGGMPRETAWKLIIGDILAIGFNEAYKISVKFERDRAMQLITQSEVLFQYPLTPQEVSNKLKTHNNGN